MGTFANSALSSLGSGLATAGVDALFSNLLAPINQSYARSQMRYQNQLSKELFDYEMMKEQQAMSASSLRSRGLNPALVYGQGAGTQTSASIGNSSLAPIAPVEANPDYRAVSDVGLNEGNISLLPIIEKQLESQIDWTGAQTNLLNLQSQAQSIQNEILQLTKNFKVGQSENEYKKSLKELDVVEQNLQKLINEVKKSNIEVEAWPDKVKNDLALQVATVANLRAQSYLYHSQVELNKQMKAKIVGEMALISEQLIEQEFVNLMNAKSQDAREAIFESMKNKALYEAQKYGRQTIKDSDSWLNRNYKYFKQSIDFSFGVLGQLLSGAVVLTGRKNIE